MSERKPGNAQRLQKILAAAGIASRRKAEELILSGRVQVNGQIVTELGTKADLEQDHIRVDGKLLHGAEQHKYFMLNKPKGYVTTVSDPEGRPTVMKFFERAGARLYPVGRLDYLSEGLIVITNDGEMANGLTRAANKVEKTYLVKVSGQPDEEAIEQLRAGVMIDRGRRGSFEGRVMTQPAQIRQIRQGENPWYEVVLTEGRNRELRKMFEEVGHHVEKIRRVGFGPLVLDVEPGEFRELTEREVLALKRAASGRAKTQTKAAAEKEKKRRPTSAQLPKPSKSRSNGRPGGKPGSGKSGPKTGSVRSSRRGR